MPRLLRQSDFILGLFASVASLIVAAVAYASMRRLEDSGQVLASTLRLGTTASKIVIDQSCPGELSTTVTFDSMARVQSSGSFRSSYGKEQIDIRFELDAQFNPLGQMHAARIIAQSEHFRGSILLSNPHPIQVTIEGSAQGRSFNRTISFPGPITIVRDRRSNTFRIEYDGKNPVELPSLRGFQGALSREFRIALIESQLAPQSCHSGGKNRLDLLPLLARIQGIMPPLLSIPANPTKESKDD
jgi:hypothetical protein